MNRRNVLVGLGTIVAGGGAALGTGAFSSVEASRTANIDVADDAAAFLALEVHSSRAADSGFVQASGGTDGNGNQQGQIEFHFDATAADGDGLNDDAVTSFDDLLTITNNGTNDVTLSIGPDDSSYDAVLTPYVGSDRNTVIDGTQILTADGTDAGDNEYGSSIDVGFEFDTTAGDASQIETIVITADEA
ncbi:hypothetical protein [Halopiger djelfimassiliensis]|uniref:hypothetical protein n=1 Tax=Halopiger djelfimassiliensis TaxID=1293047 RepID=UPI001E3BFEF2|nr:hypothetical protein [Halopiger djelfimassiliensis]